MMSLYGQFYDRVTSLWNFADQFFFPGCSLKFKMADDNGSLRLLIVNADDFGYCEQRNRGIVKSFQDGIVSSASLLVNAESALEAIQLSKKCGIPLGIHLNLTEGRPIKSKTHYKSLTSEEGFLRGKFGFREALKNEEIDLDEVNFNVIVCYEYITAMHISTS